MAAIHCKAGKVGDKMGFKGGGVGCRISMLQCTTAKLCQWGRYIVSIWEGDDSFYCKELHDLLKYCNFYQRDYHVIIIDLVNLYNLILKLFIQHKQ